MLAAWQNFQSRDCVYIFPSMSITVKPCWPHASLDEDSQKLLRNFMEKKEKLHCEDRRVSLCLFLDQSYQALSKLIWTARCCDIWSSCGTRYFSIESQRRYLIGSVMPAHITSSICNENIRLQTYVLHSTKLICFFRLMTRWRRLRQASCICADWQTLDKHGVNRANLPHWI